MKKRNLIFWNILFLFLTGIPYQARAEDNLSVIKLNSNRELFIDHFLIDQLIETRLIMHRPIDEGSVLQFEKPWEGPFCGYCTVIKDGEIYRLYYRGLPKAGKDGSTNETTCYAESKDGIAWTKPDLRIYEIMDTQDNNVILANDAPFSHNFSPFLDTNPNTKREEKYKALAGTKETGLYGFKSADGIHWKKMSEKPVFTKGIFDSQNVAFWSASENCYVCYFRTWTGDGYSGKRSVSRTTSLDFIQWSEPKAMEFGDTPLEHLYTNQTHAYFRAPHIYVAIAARFMPKRQVLNEEEALSLNVNPKYFKDCSDVVLMTSRGGNRYDRTFMESFIRPGIGLQNWVSRSNYPALNTVITGPTEMSIYVNQDYAQPTAHLRRYILRLDGFGSVNAGYNGGEMITKPLTFEGDKLLINYATSAAGEIKVEIQNEEGEVIPGFSADECQLIIGNEIDRNVSWGKDKNLNDLAGKVIRLRFLMKDADLYALKFE
ncbi:MAG: hypothetical protein KAK04_09860, partial [Cyclobacteriaceae bacterium]|nr:hypothetical protein [Cyclobacteriaceae bacterium]